MQQIGDYQAKLTHDSLPLTLHLDRAHLNRTWPHVGKTADYLIEYLTADHTEPYRDESVSSAQYIANELLENAIKYATGTRICASSGVLDHQWIMLVSHQADPGHRDNLQKFLDQLNDNTAEEVMMERILSNAQAPESSGSGLGLLTVMADHQARLGWRMYVDPDLGESIDTMARISIGKSRNGSDPSNHNENVL